MIDLIRSCSFTLLTVLFMTVFAFSAKAAAPIDAATLAPASNGTLFIATQDSTGKRVAGALVNVFDASGSVAATGTTNGAGKVSFSLPAGNYTIFASKVTVVFGFPTAIFGSGAATVTAGKPSGTTVVLDQFAP